MRRWLFAEGGFTLIELLTVLAIMAMLAVLAVPFGVRAVEDATLRSDSRKLASALHGLQMQARRDQTMIVVDPAGADTRLPKLDGGTAVHLEARGGSLSYFPDGTSSGGTLRLSEHGRAIDIDVAWLTGNVTEAAAP
jgi:general secretion pathway protein H